MMGYDYENQDLNWKFSMGDEKSDRSVGITTAADDAELKYRREINDLARFIKQLKKAQENMTELPPTEEETSEITSAIDSGAYVSKEIELGVKIKELEKKLEAAKKKFQFLFSDPD